MANLILALVRVIHIGSAMMLVALPYFALIVLRPVLTTNQSGAYLPFGQKLTRWLWILLAVQAGSGMVWFWFVAAELADESPWHLLDSSDLVTVLMQTQFGQLWAGRLCLGIALGLVLILSPGATWMTVVTWPNWCVLIISTAVLMTLAWAGHAVSGLRYHVLHIGVDVIHLLIGSVWPMGLIPLGLFLGERLPSQFLPDDCKNDVLVRFSKASVVAVIILTATGFINGCLMIGSLTALFITTYGQLLLGKVAAVVLMIGLGAWNRLFLLPRLGEGAFTVRILRRTVLAESGLAALVLVIVGAMGMTSPPSP